MSENLMDTDVKSDLLIEDARKSTNENESLKKEFLMCQEEKKDLEGKIRMNSSELTAAKVSLNKMNIGSKKLDDILCKANMVMATLMVLIHAILTLSHGISFRQTWYFGRHAMSFLSS